MNVPNETCLSNTRNYTNINKHYCVSTTVSAATDVLPGGAGVFFAVTSSRSECQYHHASLIAYARYSKADHNLILGEPTLGQRNADPQNKMVGWLNI